MRRREAVVMTLESIDSIVQRLHQSKCHVIGHGVYQIDGEGTHGEWTTLVEVCDTHTSVKVCSYFPVEVVAENLATIYEFCCRNNARFGNGFLSLACGTSLVWFKTSAHCTNSDPSEDAVPPEY